MSVPSKQPLGGASSKTSDQPDSSWPNWPFCDKDMIGVVTEVLESGKLNYWTGDIGRKFEAEYADFVGMKHAIAVTNGTVGLELALAVLDIGPGDEVIVPSRTYIATASAVVMRGATPVCADVDFNSQTITADTIRPLLTPKTRAIIPVHLAGWPCDMKPILELAKQHKLRVIEDCAQAHCARVQGQLVGSMGDLGVFSFCGDKIMTTGGEGGMVVTNSHQLWNKAWSYKDHGKCHDAAHYQQHPIGYRWLHKSFGTNFRLTELQSAIGRYAIGQLPHWVQTRRENAALFFERLHSINSLRTPVPPKECIHSFYKFYTFVRPEKLKAGWDRDRVMQDINDQGIPCFTGSCSEIYLEDAFPEEWRPKQRHPVAKELGETSLLFRVDPALSAIHIGDACTAIENTMRKASKDCQDQKPPELPESDCAA